MKQTLLKQVLTNQVLITLCSCTPVIAHLFIIFVCDHKVKNYQIFVNIQKTLLVTFLNYIKALKTIDNWVFHANVLARNAASVCHDEM